VSNILAAATENDTETGLLIVALIAIWLILRTPR
jgi:hypothetical protein